MACYRCLSSSKHHVVCMEEAGLDVIKQHDMWTRRYHAYGLLSLSLEYHTYGLLSLSVEYHTYGLLSLFLE